MSLAVLVLDILKSKAYVGGHFGELKDEACSKLLIRGGFYSPIFPKIPVCLEAALICAEHSAQVVG